MTKSKEPSDEIKTSLINGHFYYEFKMIRGCIRITKDLNPNSSYIQVPDFIAVAFFTHIRNLWEFFYGVNKNPSKEPRAIHYLPNWNLKPSKDSRELYGRINDYLSHLSYERVTGTGPQLLSFFFVSYVHIKGLTKEFLENLPEKYFDKNLEELKGWVNEVD